MKMSIVLFAAACAVLSASAVYAAPVTWDLSGMLGLSYNQTDVSDNWSGSEQDALSWQILFEGSLEMTSDTADWVTTLKEEYGRARSGTEPARDSADLIDLSTVYTRKLAFPVSPYTSFFVTTQHTEFLDPVIYTESAGFRWQAFKSPLQTLRTRAGIAFRQKHDRVDTVVDPETGAAVPVSSVDDPSTPRIEQSSSETGGEWVTNYSLRPAGGTRFTSELRVFTVFDGQAGIRWDSSLFLKTGEFLTLQLGYLVLSNYVNYPEVRRAGDVETRVTVSLGVSYNIFD